MKNYNNYKFMVKCISKVWDTETTEKFMTYEEAKKYIDLMFSISSKIYIYFKDGGKWNKVENDMVKYF